MVDGARALEAVRAETFEGMILDIDIPSMEWGWKCFGKFEDGDQQLPIVMITASGAKESAVRAVGMGAQAYMLKPFDVDELQRVTDYWFRPLERLSSESGAVEHSQWSKMREEHGHESLEQVLAQI